MEAYLKQSDKLMLKPIFEVIDKGNHYKIYENGKIEGFSKEAVVINRISLKILADKVSNLTNQKH